MKINRIELYNIGPYEGLNIFDISGQRDKGKVTVIGGKNGAGKTTLFSSIKLCLYGYREAGYQAANGFYKRSIKKLVNDRAKLENNPEAYVELDVSIFNGQDWDDYELNRSWHLNEDEFEVFTVKKNGKDINSEAINDFDNYLLNLIPPELFELYFFDGEQIADFFLEDKSGERIKRAFMTICGYDTFDIIYKNFKRLSKGIDVNSESLDEYFAADDLLHGAQKVLESCCEDIERTTCEIESVDNELAAIEKKYALSGGVSIEEWNKNFIDLKAEERIREEKNAWLKNAANDMIPYIILHDEIDMLTKQMELERDIERQNILIEAMDSIIPEALDDVAKSTSNFSSSTRKKVQEKLLSIITSQMKDGTSILNLSKDEYGLLLRQASQMIEYDGKQITNVRKEIKKSLKRSQTSRESIESSSISEIDGYLKKKNQLIEDKASLLKDREDLMIKQKDLQAEVEKATIAYRNAEKNLEKHFKDESISSLTARSIKFLDVLQKRLFHSEIEKVENLFIKKMAQLMRKEQFVSKITIDDDFTIHVYRNVELRGMDIANSIISMGVDGYNNEFSTVHCDDLLLKAKCESLEQFVSKYQNSEKKLNVLMEFDKTTMSKGEKQVFIMALYWSMMELCNKEVPFVIDTPFARIDTIHRDHITKYFFKELKGQVFIFSTDEEITKEHLKVLGRDLQSKFLIENIDNTKTEITVGKYFED